MWKWIFISIGIIVVAGAYWAFAPLLYDVEVDDETPITNLEQSPESVSGPFPIEETTTHPARGLVSVVRSDDETIIRYENYEGTNGPDLYVYLAKDLEANEFISLGRAKGNKGNINYTVPAGIDVSDYQYVLTWCKAFGVLFDYSKIN